MIEKIKNTIKKIAKASPLKKKGVVLKGDIKTKTISKRKTTDIKVSTIKKVLRPRKKIIVVSQKTKNQHKAEEVHLKLEKSPSNPIISPSLYGWESKATFNPAAFEHNGKIHILYRAVGEDEVSVLGYASSFDGLNIEDRPTFFAYKRFFEYKEKGPKADYLSGGGWCGGCEDPRMALIDDTVYVIYTAFDGWGSVRIALTSINLADFKKKKWNWNKATLISPPGQINKNWVLFPEKINGKFAILHSFYPKILIDYFNDLKELDGNHFIKSNNSRPFDETRTWDSWFRGVGPTPIKTKDGWLILYHAMDRNNPDRYRLGALLLDLNDPTKVLFRSQKPILEPEEDYENNGHKWGVIYSCGAVVKNGDLFVYYGGADKFVCVASIPLEDLLNDLKADKAIKLTKNKIIKSI